MKMCLNFNSLHFFLSLFVFWASAQRLFVCCCWWSYSSVVLFIPFTNCSYFQLHDDHRKCLIVPVQRTCFKLKFSFVHHRNSFLAATHHVRCLCLLFANIFFFLELVCVLIKFRSISLRPEQAIHLQAKTFPKKWKKRGLQVNFAINSVSYFMELDVNIWTHLVHWKQGKPALVRKRPPRGHDAH